MSVRFRDPLDELIATCIEKGVPIIVNGKRIEPEPSKERIISIVPLEELSPIDIIA